MTSRFRLTVERAPGSLERVLAVARRRRLGLESVTVTSNGPDRFDVAIVAGVPSGEGSLALRNFAALVNVRHAAIEDASGTRQSRGLEKEG